MENDKMSTNDEEPILVLIQRIKDGTVNPKTLPPEDRQRCVDFLWREGYTQEQIGQVLKRNERTIRRDLERIEERNSMSPSVDLAKKIIGNTYQKAMGHHRYLMRLARNPDASNSEKAQSEFLAWRVLKEMVEKMQSLGYLPQKQQEVVTDVFHHSCEADGEKDIVEIRAMLFQIEQTAKEVGIYDDRTQEQIKALQAEVEKAELTSQVKKLQDNVNKTKEQKDEQEESHV